MGSLVSLLYVLVSASNALIFPSYAVWSITTVTFPLSAGAMTMSSASLSALMAFCSSGERLVGGGLDFARQPAILVLASCASAGRALLLHIASYTACNEPQQEGMLQVQCTLGEGGGQVGQEGPQVQY